MDLEGQMTLEPSYGFYFEPGQSGFAMFFAWMFTISSLHFVEAFQGFLFSGKTRLRQLARDLHLLPFSSGTFSLALHLLGTCIHHPVSMVRECVRPHRGSAWDTHKAQRRRKKHLECALALASSILRKKARAEQRMLLDTIAEQRAGCSREGPSNLSDVREAEPEVALPTYIVEEDPSMGDLLCIEEPRAMEGSIRVLAREDDFPSCIIEETPWPGDLPSFHAEKTVDTEVSTEQREVAADLDEAMDSGTAPYSGLGGRLHGFLLSDEHLALVFELCSHLADMELRMLLMSQHIDILLSVFSGAPAQRKCPVCVQEFSIPAGSTWEGGEGNKATSD